MAAIFGFSAEVARMSVIATVQQGQREHVSDDEVSKTIEVYISLVNLSLKCMMVDNQFNEAGLVGQRCEELISSLPRKA